MSASQPTLTFKNLQSGVRFLTAGLVNLLFPTICAACNRPGPMICATCLDQARSLGANICQRCGRPSANPSEDCILCRKDDFRLRQSRACFAYTEPLATVIHKFKYEGFFALAEPLGQEMADNWPSWISTTDMLVPIPLHNRRKRLRGFNQSALLAHHLGDKLRIVVDEKVLARVRDTTPQVGLNPEERESNVRGAFSADPSEVSGKHIVLVDDVFTTGATMNAAASALQSAGAASVSAFCLALAVQ